MHKQNSSYFIYFMISWRRMSRTTGTARNWFLAILVKILVYYVQDLAVKFAHEYMLAACLAVKFAHEYFYREFHQVFRNINENEVKFFLNIIFILFSSCIHYNFFLLFYLLQHEFIYSMPLNSLFWLIIFIFLYSPYYQLYIYIYIYKGR